MCLFFNVFLTLTFSTAQSLTVGIPSLISRPEIARAFFVPPILACSCSACLLLFWSIFEQPGPINAPDPLPSLFRRQIPVIYSLAPPTRCTTHTTQLIEPSYIGKNRVEPLPSPTGGAIYTIKTPISLCQSPITKQGCYTLYSFH